MKTKGQEKLWHNQPKLILQWDKHKTLKTS